MIKSKKNARNHIELECMRVFLKYHMGIMEKSNQNQDCKFTKSKLKFLRPPATSKASPNGPKIALIAHKSSSGIRLPYEFLKCKFGDFRKRKENDMRFNFMN